MNADKMEFVCAKTAGAGVRTLLGVWVSAVRDGRAAGIQRGGRQRRRKAMGLFVRIGTRCGGGRFGFVCAVEGFHRIMEQPFVMGAIPG
jgi:hypothetical protein